MRLRPTLLSIMLLSLLLLSGCARVVTSGTYTLARGETISGDLVITAGSVTIEEGALVNGSVLMTSGNVVVNGEINGDVALTSGVINFGPTAVVRGEVSYVSGQVQRASGARIEGTVRPSAGIGGRFIGWLLMPVVVLGALLWLAIFLLGGSRAPRQPAAMRSTPSGEGKGTMSELRETGPAPGAPTHKTVNTGLALALIAIGGLFLAQQMLGIDIGHYGWPFFIIIPGLLFFVGMLLSGPRAGGLAVPGSIITLVGLVLLYQNTTGHWESWAYAWALVGPTAVGLGLWIQGWWSGQPHLMRDGQRVATIGLIIFLVAAIFFELVLNISGLTRGSLGGFIGPALLIAAGFWLLFGRGRWPATPQPVSPTPADQPLAEQPPLEASLTPRGEEPPDNRPLPPSSLPA